MPDKATTASDLDAATPRVSTYRAIDVVGGTYDPNDEFARGRDRMLREVLAILRSRGFDEYRDPVSPGLDVLLARCGLILSRINGDGICFDGIDEGQLYADVVFALGLDDKGNPDPEMTAIVARGPARETSIEAQLRNARQYLGHAQMQRDAAIRAQSDLAARLERTTRIMRAVILEAQRPPADVGRLIGKDPTYLSGAEAAEVALWGHECEGRAIRFVAELATMTDVEADFLDGHEARTIARLLQVPDDEGGRAPTLPRFYSEDDRSRAIDALEEATHAKSAMAGMTRRWYQGETVDTVAEALGMRRAGA